MFEICQLQFGNGDNRKKCGTIIPTEQSSDVISSLHDDFQNRNSLTYTWKNINVNCYLQERRFWNRLISYKAQKNMTRQILSNGIYQIIISIDEKYRMKNYLEGRILHHPTFYSGFPVQILKISPICNISEIFHIRFT